MKRLLATGLTVGALLTTPCFISPASAGTPIQFRAGAESGSWAGRVGAFHDFDLYMMRGQAFRIESSDVDGWSVITPSGRELTPDENGYVFLREDGKHTVRTRFILGERVGVQSGRKYKEVTIIFRAYFPC